VAQHHLAWSTLTAIDMSTHVSMFSKKYTNIANCMTCLLHFLKTWVMMAAKNAKRAKTC